MELVGFSSHSLRRINLDNELADRAAGYIEETLESAGCTGNCPTYPGAPRTEDGYFDCSKCPECIEE